MSAGGGYRPEDRGPVVAVLKQAMSTSLLRGAPCADRPRSAGLDGVGGEWVRARAPYDAAVLKRLFIPAVGRGGHASEVDAVS